MFIIFFLIVLSHHDPFYCMSALIVLPWKLMGARFSDDLLEQHAPLDPDALQEDALILL